jgi:hypothetical protein
MSETWRLALKMVALRAIKNPFEGELERVFLNKQKTNQKL